MAVANQQGFGAKNDLRTMGKASTAKRAPGAVLSAEMVLESILLQSERRRCSGFDPIGDTESFSPVRQGSLPRLVAVGSIRLGILKERRDKLADCAPVRLQWVRSDWGY